MICTAIMAADPDSALEQARRARAAGAEAVEIRGDLFRTFPLDRLAASLPLPALFTLRSPEQGGAYSGGEGERLALLEEASRAGFQWVDVEWTAHAAPERFHCPVLLSHHDFSGMPEDLRALARSMTDAGPWAVKIVVTPRTADDFMGLCALQRSRPGRSAIFAMGPLAVPSRVLGRISGDVFTYAALEEGQETAPGQPELGRFLNTYRFHSLNSQTRVYGLVGLPALHSAGPRVHNALFENAELDAVYLPFETDDPAPLMDQAEALSLDGLSVTMPHKQTVLSRVTDLDALAGRIGAVNTLRFEKGKIFGLNTDAEAIAGALSERLGSLVGRAVLVLGAGGAARAAAVALSNRDARLHVANRSPLAGKALAREVNGSYHPLSDPGLEGMDAVVQATPVGMGSSSGEIPVPGGRFTPGTVVLETIYHPRRTAFTQMAREQGAEVIEGMEIFARQAAAQFTAWTGRPADWRSILRELEREEEA